MSEKIIDVEPVKEQTQALQVRETGGAVGKALPPEDIKPPITAAQAKIEAVANLTMSAYERAATLQITPEEIAKLKADFPDEAFKPGASGKEHLLYVEHPFLRDRMNEVFGMGQWALIPRSRWAEDYTFVNKHGQTVEASRVYVEAMLVVRGCFVGEAIGDMVYFKNNDSQNYGDAVEGAKTAAFRRCAKEFGIGLQAWKKDWCNGWFQRNRSSGNVKATYSRPSSQNAPGSPSAATPPVTGGTPFQRNAAPKAQESAHTEGFATESYRTKMIATLQAGLNQPARAIVTEYFQKIDQLLPNEEVEDLPLRFVPANKEQMLALTGKISDFANGLEVAKAFPPNEEPPKAKGAKAKPIEVPRDPKTYANSDDPDHPEAAWRIFPMPFGKNAGVCLEDLEKNYLFGLWANFEVETEYNGKPKKAETIERDTEFRHMLDAAGEHYKFEKKD